MYEVAPPRWWIRLAAGIAAGATIAGVDTSAFHGEVSPIVIVALLLVASGCAGSLWGRHGWAPALAAAACVPLAHVAKHVLGWPDTLHPNTYQSIIALAAFTLCVAATGTGGGVLARRLIVRTT